ADPERAGLLYCGTETGLYISFDDGATWEHFQLNLPVAPVHELLVRGTDLIAGTHGRAIWILDDVSPLRQMGKLGKAHLFRPRRTERITPNIDWSGNVAGKNYLSSSGGAYIFDTTEENEIVPTYLDVGQNPPKGAIITYYLKQQPKGVLTLTFSDASGKEIRSFKSRDPEATEKPKDRLIPAREGWNRFVWDLRHAPVTKIEGSDPAAEATIDGPLVAPGTYQVTLNSGDTTLTEPFEVIKPGALPASDEDLQAQYGLLRQVYDKQNETIAAINRMRDLRQQLDGWAKRVTGAANGEAIADTATKLRDKVLEIEKELLVPDLRPGWADNINNGVRLLAKLSSVGEVVELGDYRPTDQAYQV
ncbi:MAG TPA: glycosyl hydrolase, partial [Roseiflexaceae bacterium]|nr:glycosyl hydrolase [Roseiflexaceae bacterium]